MTWLWYFDFPAGNGIFLVLRLRSLNFFYELMFCRLDFKQSVSISFCFKNVF